MTARVEDRTFEQLHMDVNLVGLNDPRPVELVNVQRNPFAFISEPPLTIPMVTRANSWPRSCMRTTAVRTFLACGTSSTAGSDGGTFASVDG